MLKIPCAADVVFSSYGLQKLFVHRVFVRVVVGFANIHLATYFARLSLKVDLLTLRIANAPCDISSCEVTKWTIIYADGDTFGVLILATFDILFI